MADQTFKWALEKNFDSGKSSLTLDKFRSEVMGVGGHANVNKFEIRLAPPAAVTDSNMIRRLVLRCESANMPGVNLSTVTDTNIYGPTREVVEGVSYAETVDLVFILDQDMNIRNYFEDWMQLAYNPTTWNVRYYYDYVGAVDIFVLDNDLRPRYGIRLWEAYPKTINAIELNNTSSNEIAKITVSMEFRYWSNISKFGDREPPKITEITPTIGDPNFAEASDAMKKRQREEFRAAERRGSFGASPPAGVSGTSLKPNSTP